MSSSATAKPPHARTRRKRLTLRELAKERGFRSLNALAIEAKISQPVCSQANRGMVPRPLYLAAIAQTLGVTTDAVLDAINCGHAAAKRALAG